MSPTALGTRTRCATVCGGYPRLLTDRDVVALRDGQPEQAWLRGWLYGHDARCRLTGLMRPGLRGRREDLVGTLDDASPGQLATVGEQRAFAEEGRQ